MLDLIGIGHGAQSRGHIYNGVMVCWSVEVIDFAGAASATKIKMERCGDVRTICGLFWGHRFAQINTDFFIKRDIHK